MNQDPLVLVTGGAGFIGSHLVERLLADGKHVVVIDDFSTGSKANLQHLAAHPRLRLLASRVSRCEELPQLASGAESIYHLAATVGVERVLESPLRAIETNLRETEAVLQAAAASRTRVLVASSSEVYGKSDKALLSEDDDLLIGPPTQPRWSYACSKLMDEFLALAFRREQGLPAVIVRLFNTVGPRQSGRYGMVLPRFVAAARANQRLRVFGDGTQTRCFCDVGDVVEALVRLQRVPEASGEVVNVGSTEEVSIHDLALRVIEALGSTSSVEFVPYHLAYRGPFEDLRRRRPDVSKLAALTGFKPKTSLRTVILRSAAG
ncbi:MAG TPA: NAD-dependent epimerase/dehydratase family protein [Candidatus Saccharimonadales bacterium]|nr:NAD-dependent epimerase/dehydratase family protein [Candidatus Saccharimonadales bacterium]